MIISGGYLEQSVELYDLYNLSSCLLPELSHQTTKHSQVKWNYYDEQLIADIQNGMLTCGGERLNKGYCRTFVNGSWSTEKIELQEDRWEHSSWEFEQGILLIGGVASPVTTEIVLSNGSTVMHYDLKQDTRHEEKSNVKGNIS